MELDYTGLDNLNTGSRPAGPQMLPEHSVLYAEQRERQRMRQTYAEYQENIKRAGGLRCEILKGIQQRRDPQEILLLAVECIGRMTGDRELLPQVETNLRIISGDIPTGTDLHRLVMIRDSIDAAIGDISDPLKREKSSSPIRLDDL